MQTINPSEYQGPLTRRDQRIWAKATSIPDLCALTVRWLQGDLRALPSYDGSVDVDEEFVPGMTATLIGLNKAGFLTTCSQAGINDLGKGYLSYAAVEGYANQDTLHWLGQFLIGRGVDFIHHTMTRPHRRFPQGSWVTFDNREPFTLFGCPMGRASIAGSDDDFGDFQGCSEAAIEEVCAASKVAIIDRSPGQNGLWTRLAEMVASGASSSRTD